MVLDILSGKHEKGIVGGTGAGHHLKHFMKYTPKDLSDADNWDDSEFENQDEADHESKKNDDNLNLHIRVSA